MFQLKFAKKKVHENGRYSHFIGYAVLHLLSYNRYFGKHPVSEKKEHNEFKQT